MEEWIKKMPYIHTIEYYSTLKIRKSCHNVGEPEGHYKRNEPVTGQILHDSTDKRSVA